MQVDQKSPIHDDMLVERQKAWGGLLNSTKWSMVSITALLILLAIITL